MAASWKIEIHRSAKRDLDSFREEWGDDAYDGVLQDIEDLKEDPTPPESTHLRGTKDHYRIYTFRSRYRIVYRVNFGKRTIRITRVRPRRTAYSGFDRW